MFVTIIMIDGSVKVNIIWGLNFRVRVLFKGVVICVCLLDRS